MHAARPPSFPRPDESALAQPNLLAPVRGVGLRKRVSNKAAAARSLITVTARDSARTNRVSFRTFTGAGRGLSDRGIRVSKALSRSRSAPRGSRPVFIGGAQGKQARTAERIDYSKPLNRSAGAAPWTRLTAARARLRQGEGRLYRNLYTSNQTEGTCAEGANRRLRDRFDASVNQRLRSHRKSAAEYRTCSSKHELIN